MSGICGQVWWGRRPVAPEELDAMLAPVAYRGPDGVRRWTGGGVGLAHLAHHVTPESVHEVQPLEDPRSGLVLVADVRIDNRDELIPQLRARGELPTRAAVCSDAEVILAAYRVWGDGCPARLLGDYAFAIWDGARRRLFLARDPMGMRPLFFRSESRRFLFASEIKQLLATPGVPSDLFLPSLAAHLAGGFGLPEWTAFAGVHRLPPGHSLVAREGEVRHQRAWTLDGGDPIRYRSDQGYVEHFLDLFRLSVRARLRSIRPVGLLLSGGLDSGAIAAAGGEFLAGGGKGSVPGLRAYSFAWSELAQCDERHISGPLAHHLDIPVTEVPADDAWPLRADGDPALDGDSPFLFSHYVLLDRTFRMAHAEGMGLMLSGDRGDLVSGMGICDLPHLFRTGQWVTLVRELRVLAGWRGRSLRGQARSELIRLAQEVARVKHPFWSRLPRLRRLGAPRALRPPPWLMQELARELREDDHEAWIEPVPSLPTSAARERHRMIFTPLHMLGVEASERMHARWRQAFADPWSDRRLVEFACRVPQRAMNRVGEPKRLTRMALKESLPSEHVDRMRKIVPTPLFQRGLWEREVGRIRELLTDSEADRMGLVDGRRLKQAYEELCRSPRGNPTQLWQALTLEMWLRVRMGRHFVP
jgi:asparagine synthase (glutamine-hydrolysing)